MEIDPAILAELAALQETPLSIIRLADPISASAHAAPTSRKSDASSASASTDAPTPASLDADLAHYRELFSKLRFSYVEQVTKEKFIRAIVGEPPMIVTPPENAALETQNLAAKAQLKALKTQVAEIVAQLDARARDLARRSERVRVDTAALRDLPAATAQVERSLADLRRERDGWAREAQGNPDMALPLARTLEAVGVKKKEMAALDRELDQLRARAMRKATELERIRTELGPLNAKVASSAAAAKEAQRRKEAALGGGEDDLEERGRWFRANEAVLKQIFES
ncbi:hypothetical protein TD95_003192 [Thielaviopsis punctulata]|uniref:Kinetochore protein Sos7 coiled-coil domain-containing protein n=1 Tax=Thielaviopsis punctulata TaxID=72032 RepID=A0A0F4ZET4_9PEZI|nr:hypothetical protein TD95_003192 [Thielaviopsis punctulata]